MFEDLLGSVLDSVLGSGEGDGSGDDTVTGGFSVILAEDDFFFFLWWGVRITSVDVKDGGDGDATGSSGAILSKSLARGMVYFNKFTEGYCCLQIIYIFLWLELRH